jgi:hypothetical protein
MITDYDVVSEHYLSELKSRVAAMLAQGWQPHLSLHVTALVSKEEIMTLYTQVMVKKDGPDALIEQALI